jgi:sec-independent protein translocase protein TatA
VVLGEIFSWDILIVLAVIALLFGGAKLPKLARSLGSAKGEFERGLRDGAPLSPESPTED